MNTVFRLKQVIAIATAAAVAGPWLCAVQQAPAQTVADGMKPQSVAANGTVESVVLYRGRAAVTRVVRQSLDQGVWAVRVGNLPQSVQGNTIQAKVVAAGGQAGGGAAGGGAAGAAGTAAGGAAGGEPRMLGVEYSETPLSAFGGSPEGIALAEKLRGLRQQSDYMVRDNAQLEQQLKLVEQIGVRATANATADGGTQAIDLDAVARQLAFVATQRKEIVEKQRALAASHEELARQIDATQKEFDARGGAERVDRAAVVVIAAPAACAVELSVTYIVGSATWEPAYNIRAKGDRTGVEIEYDAMITQATGEDWLDVQLALSTAQPSRASAPPPVVPWFIDAFVPPPASPPPGRPMAGGVAMEMAPPAPMADASGGDRDQWEARRKSAEIDKLSSAAAVQETGTAVSFALPRKLDVPTDSAKKQRTRIASLEPGAEFVYSAQPLVTEDVYLRGNLTNTSAFQLLPGRAQVFMGGDFIGETNMPSVAPKDEFRVFFGPDRALRATRQLVSKTTGSSGFFGGSQTTTWNYRVLVDNSTGRAAVVELFDRRPVSVHEKIVCAVSKLSAPLSTDKEYVDGPMTQGILRWDLSVPSTARGASALPVTWTVEVTRPNDLPITTLPD